MQYGNPDAMNPGLSDDLLKEISCFHVQIRTLQGICMQQQFKKNKETYLFTCSTYIQVTFEAELFIVISDVYMSFIPNKITFTKYFGALKSTEKSNTCLISQVWWA